MGLLKSNTYFNETGSLSAELVVLTPILLAVIFVFIIGLRVERTSILLRSAVKNAAELAAVAGSPTLAELSVNEHIEGELATQGIYCNGGPNIKINSSNYHAGGTVSVTLICNVSLSTVQISGIGPSVTERATGTAPIDPYVSQFGG